MKNSKNLFIPFILATVVLPIFSQSLDKPLATVRLTSNTVITARQFESKVELLEQELGITLSGEQKTSLLNSEIDTELIMQAAEREGITAAQEEIQGAIQQQKAGIAGGQAISDTQFRQLIESQMGMSWADYTDRLKRRIIQEKFIAQRNQDFLSQVTNPTPSEIQSVYEDNAAEFVSPAYVRFDHLFIDTRSMNSQDKQQALSRMEDIYSEIRSSGNSAFNRYMQSSVDDPSLSGGDFGYLPKNEQSTTQVLGQAFINSAFALNQNEFSDVLTSNVGIHILRITDKRSPKLLTLNDPVVPGQNLTVRQQIIQYIRAQQQQQRLAEAIEKTTEELRNEADVRIFTQNLSW
ncbi:peptidyl-prolyl cis-trans isomerase [Spirochaeta lutea]|uniref:peptidyl-prolyl cis-trans isomerase n=1 Tax=Spirochaeta lutea TaxID=1480694 RepID=UPI000A4A6CD0|nr:peptidyl-prolyl cis-trans isomerase [Spirochaeta lutea]